MGQQSVETHLANASPSGQAVLGECGPLWARSLGDPSVCIAVLDGPVDLTHPCFEGADITLIGASNTSGTSGGQAARHGTLVSSVIFGQHHSAVRGVAPRCRGIIDSIFSSREDGSIVPCSQLDLARAITRAVGYGANIINISGGQFDTTGEAQHHLSQAIKLCAENNVLIVTSTGNDGCDCLQVPAGEPSVLVVGAMDSAGNPLEFSNWSDAYRGRGILARGEDILGAVPGTDVAGGATAAYSGTSFATAIVSGVAGVLMSLQRQHNEPIDSPAVRQALLASAISCDEQPASDCRRLMSGRLNIPGAISHLFQGADSEMSEHQQQVETGPGNRVSKYLENGAAPPPPEVLESEAMAQVQSPVATPSRPADPAPRGAVAQPEAPPAEKAKSGCGCGCGGGGSKVKSLVFALGQIDFDYGTEARRDSFVQQSMRNPGNPMELLDYLDQNPWAAARVIWTLVQETTPIYAIRPAGPFAQEAYSRLRGFLRGQLEEGVSLVSIAGLEAGTVTLLNGQEVPMIVPDIAGMYCWSTPALIEAALGQRPDNGEGSAYDEQAAEVGNFLERVYYEISNLGIAPQERAINYAATNAYQVAYVYRDAIKQRLSLDRIDVDRSNVCRPGSDCWDVKLTFFDPVQRHERAKQVYRFTIDVSETVPVTVGKVRRWSAN